MPNDKSLKSQAKQLIGDFKCTFTALLFAAGRPNKFLVFYDTDLGYKQFIKHTHILNSKLFTHFYDPSFVDKHCVQPQTMDIFRVFEEYVLFRRLRTD